MSPSPSPARAVRLSSPAAERNRGPIAEVLARLLPATGRALEVASGAGLHVVHFAQAFPGWRWQPSDPSPEARASIAAWTAHAGVGDRVEPPLALDLLAGDAADGPGALPAAAFDLVFCANLLHISPAATGPALMALAARVLRPGGRLVTYGPYLEDEVATAPSNLAFDADLKARDPAWGLRRREDVARAAADAGLAFVERVAMPANNLLLVFARPAGA